MICVTGNVIMGLATRGPESACVEIEVINQTLTLRMSDPEIQDSRDSGI